MDGMHAYISRTGTRHAWVHGGRTQQLYIYLKKFFHRTKPRQHCDTDPCRYASGPRLAPAQVRVPGKANARGSCFNVPIVLRMGPPGSAVAWHM